MTTWDSFMTHLRDTVRAADEDDDPLHHELQRLVPLVEGGQEGPLLEVFEEQYRLWRALRWSLYFGFEDRQLYRLQRDACARVEERKVRPDGVTYNALRDNWTTLAGGQFSDAFAPERSPEDWQAEFCMPCRSEDDESNPAVTPAAPTVAASS
jgi:hypothetical protein